MTVFVFRDGKIVPKPGRCTSKAEFPTPHVSRIEPFLSPVTETEISSWRQRDRDMNAAGAVDPRDLPRQPFEKRQEYNERSRKRAPKWGGID